MKKIKKWLKDNDFEIKYEGSYSGEHYGGKSFYNDGTYNIDKYSVPDTNFAIEHKSTGRPAFYIYLNESLTTMAFSQNETIQRLQELLKTTKD